jgi:hypothetical protein
MSRSAAALHVYLSYTLSATLEQSAQLKARFDGSGEMRGCVAACETVLRYVRSAQCVCGALGLLAIDRSQEDLGLRLTILSAVPNSNSHDTTMWSVAALCYVNALNRQCMGDSELYELWLFAAKCLDTITSRKPNHPWVVTAAEGTRKALTTKAIQFGANQKTALKAGRIWNSKFLTRASRLCRLAVACSQITDIYTSGNGVLPLAVKTVHFLTRQRYLAAQSAVTMFECYVTVCDIADRVHPVEMQGLVRRAAERLDEAVELIAARPTEAPGSYDDRVQSDKQRRGDVLANNASILANLASALSAALTQLADMRATAAVPESFLDGVAEQLQRLTAEITASANNGGSDAVHVTGKIRLSAAIGRIAEQLNVAQNSAASWEERAIQRYRAEADKVRTADSPAHAQIAECWLQAATHMRLAVDACVAASASVAPQHGEKHKACSKMCEKLASGVFRDAAAYFEKAERATCAHARSLWSKAADMLLQAGVARSKLVEEVAALDGFNRTKLSSAPEAEAALLRCAAACGACAAAMEGAPTAEVEAAVAALLGSRSPVSCASSAAEERVSHSIKGAYTVLHLRILLVHAECATLENPVACNGTDTALKQLRALVEATLLISQPSAVVLPTFPEGHLLHLSPESPDRVQQRGELLHWLWRIPVECYECLQQALGAQRASTCSAARFDNAMEAVVTAVRLAESVRWYADETGYSYPPYRVHTYEQANVYRVLCKVNLAASRAVLADRPLAHALLLRAVQQHVHRSSMPFTFGLSNALVHRAWELSSEPEPLPSDLLFPEAEASVDSVHQPSLLEVFDAHVQQATHNVTLERGSFRVQKETSLHSSAIEHYGYVINDHNRHLAKGAVSRAAGTCARAMRAANWFGRAVEALHNRRCEEARLYERATHFCVAVDYNTDRNEQAQRVGDQAAAQFAAAAEALSTGDRPLYQSWLTAAEATAKLLDLWQRKPNRHAPRTIAFSAYYSAEVLTAANLLAAQAAALQKARQTNAPQRTAPKPSGSARLQATEPVLGKVQGKVGTRRGKRATGAGVDAGAEGTVLSGKRKRD